jgi:uncharacterized protein YcfL
MRPRPIIYFFLLCLIACTSKPSYVLSDKKMENVLFDLYLAEAGVTENAALFYNDSVKKQEFLQSVFKKHHTTQAKFDTSLVWYNAHMQRYMKINTQLTDRYDRLIRQLETEAERRARALQKDSIRLEDLNLKDYLTPFLSPWIPKINADSLLQASFFTKEDTISAKNDTLVIQKSLFSIKNDTIYGQPDFVSLRKDSFSIRKDTLLIQKDTLRTWKDILLTSKDTLQTQQDTLLTSKDTLQTQKDTLQTSKGTLRIRQDTLRTQKDVLRNRKDLFLTRKDTLLNQKALP